MISFAVRSVCAATTRSRVSFVRSQKIKVHAQYFCPAAFHSVTRGT